MFRRLASNDVGGSYERANAAMSEGRKVAAILVADVVGYSRLTNLDEEATLALLKSLRSELFDPTIEARGGRVVKRLGDGVIVDFRSVVEAVRCATDLLRCLAERNARAPPNRKIEMRIGIHLGDVIEEADGDLMGDGVNIAARLESVCEPGAVYLSEDAWRQVRDRLPETFVDLGELPLKNIPRPMRTYALGASGRAGATVLTVQPGGDVPPGGEARALAATRDRRAALTDALLAILERVGQAFGLRPANATGAPLSEAAAKAMRANDRRLRRTLIIAAILSIAAIRACHEEVRAPAPLGSGR